MSVKTYAVSTVGINDREKGTLKQIFRLSLYRTNSYTIVMDNEPSQFLVVDADNPEAMAEWDRLSSGADHRSMLSQNSAPRPIAALMVSKERTLVPNPLFPYVVHRPMLATHVLSALDQIVVDSEKPPPHMALVVDDSSTIRKQIELELMPFNIKVDSVESGQQAFELLAKKDYDIMFLDVVLPGMDGYQICKLIKKDKAKKNMPIIMLTSKSSPFDRVRGHLAGCDSYLTKPVKQSSFEKMIKKYLS